MKSLTEVKNTLQELQLLEQAQHLEDLWTDEISKIIRDFYHQDISEVVGLSQTLAILSQKNYQKDNRKIIVGVCGPGATGKGTLSDFLINKLGYSKVVNTTTREARDYEVEGEHYYFLNQSEFDKKATAGSFVCTTERPGRGWYGTEKSEIINKLQASEAGCVIEDNPENLAEIFQSLDETPDTRKVVLSILPPSPIVMTCAQRLIYRLSLEKDPAKRVLTADIFESTIGKRQVEEYRHLHELISQPEVDFITLVNNDLEASFKSLRQLF